MDTRTVNPPASLLAELTHRCPLHCVYCSNPLELARREEELPTATWLRILREAAELGVLQAHLSGGEPLLRPDVVTLVEGASRFDLFTNVITSGVGLTPARARALRDAGLGSVQLSIQAADAISNRAIAGQDAWRPKLQAAHNVREAGLPLSVNVVLHRQNLHQVTALLELAESLGAERIELANAQYYGWALINRDYLLPSREMLTEAKDAVARFRERASTAMEILWVIPDYYADFPKPCMNGWGRTFITVAPDGRVLPCPAASVISGLCPPSATEHPLRWIWYESPAFNRFRGFEWMSDPCRRCPKRFADFGGCRCQAYLLAGNAAVTDPVCIYSPHHAAITEAIDTVANKIASDPIYRHPRKGSDPVERRPDQARPE